MEYGFELACDGLVGHSTRSPIATLGHCRDLRGSQDAERGDARNCTTAQGQVRVLGLFG